MLYVAIHWYQEFMILYITSLLAGYMCTCSHTRILSLLILAKRFDYYIAYNYTAICIKI